jgi:hypothetical protein
MSLSTLPRHETPLVGGTTNAGRVSRVGDTVRRPDRPTSASTKALLDHLEHRGFAGAPRYLGTDDEGREVLSYIPGQAAIEPAPPWVLTDEALVSVAELLRGYHDAVADFDPGPHRWSHAVPARFRLDVVSHNDPNLDNVVFRDGRAIALIDFDLASPGSRAWDLACTARLWVPLRAGADMPAAVRRRSLQRLALLADAYGADREQRLALVDALPECHRWCYAIVREAVAHGHPTFSSQWRAGSGARAARTGRWLAAHGSELRRALGVR